MAYCTKRMAIKFPEGSRPIRILHVTGWMDDSILLKIVVPATHVDELIANSPFSAVEWSRTRRSIHSGSDSVGWGLDDVTEFRSAQIAGPAPGECLSILIDMAATDNVPVYIEWYET